MNNSKLSIAKSNARVSNGMSLFLDVPLARWNENARKRSGILCSFYVEKYNITTTTFAYLNSYISVMFDSKRNHLLLGDAFDIAFASFEADAVRFKENWNERIHTIDDDRISPRVLNHWIKNDLIEDERPEGKGWHRFSSSDMFWIKTLIKLRQFGVPIETLKLVKKELEVGADSLSKRPLLEYYIAYTFFEKKPARILVFSNGEALIASQEEIDTALQFGTIKDDFIPIPSLNHNS